MPTLCAAVVTERLVAGSALPTRPTDSAILLVMQAKKDERKNRTPSLGISEMIPTIARDNCSMR
ncbi:MAG: hypothetical protein ACYC9Z_08805 [Casimicrobiaceae bacterium]